MKPYFTNPVGDRIALFIARLNYILCIQAMFMQGRVVFTHIYIYIIFFYLRAQLSFDIWSA